MEAFFPTSILHCSTYFMELLSMLGSLDRGVCRSIRKEYLSPCSPCLLQLCPHLHPHFWPPYLHSHAYTLWLSKSSTFQMPSTLCHYSTALKTHLSLLLHLSLIPLAPSSSPSLVPGLWEAHRYVCIAFPGPGDKWIS